MAFLTKDLSEYVLMRMREARYKSKGLEALMRRIEKGGVTYADAEQLALIIGDSSGKVIAEVLAQNSVDGRVTEEIARAVMSDPLKDNYKYVADACDNIQTILNRKAGLGLKPVRPLYDSDRVEGLIKEVVDKEDVQSFTGVLIRQIENISLSIVDESVKENAKVHYNIGLSPKIERIAEAGCCEWCSGLAGIYDYYEVNNTGNDVFRRHNNCRCQVLYDPAKGMKRQNVHSKRLLSADESAKMKARKFAGLNMTAFSKRAAYNSKADPMADAFGRGIDSNPDEIAAFKKECEELGVKVIERENESLNYQPSPRLGFPGQISVSKGASYSAWCHEMQHMRDDRNSGWDGALKVWDNDEHFRREKAAYDIEIQMAIDNGRPDIAKLLRQNLEEERRRIYGIS